MVAGRYRNVRQWLCGLTAVSILMASAGAGSPSNSSTKVSNREAPGEDPSAPFAVVELFTSEFCGACPAADQVLSEIGAQARKNGQRILPLAFHVDYFDSGNATDPFGNSAFSKRQRAYASALNTDDLYTPQMLVNGRNPFVGSQRETAGQLIRTALKQRATAAVKLNIAEPNKSTDTIKVNCEVQGAATAANLQVAVVERDLATGTRNGRAGQRHDNVVRVFKSIPLSKGTVQTVELTLPRNLNRKNASVVGFVQDTRSLAIRGAASIELDQSLAGERVASAAE